ncbi:serine--tRNA ligase [Bermanella marisrubri]|uniref:Serine--tRNA ligase n=1 Tax=Bermanella marisrubri TaxID=207949 RepID=Q1N4M2_9GAMM|nr:serine--tRNA ligase [Bermanella marisrubri]EAT13406.1 seryl-tRNA synthetase [Oceanobacter sp. RED65] [Bermanella marisrubri]QIZ84156.1 serine--tRNA ligase [Bermanella marisrubri]
MLDIRRVRENPEEVAVALKKKGYDFDIESFKSLDAKRKQADVESQNLQAEKKKASKQVGMLIKEGLSPEEAKKKALSGIDDKLEASVAQAKEIQQQIQDLLLSIPNIPDSEVPEGSDEEDNVEVRTWGDPKAFDFEVKDHVDVGQAIGGLDFELAAKITGSRFAVMRGDIARLHRALTQFMLNTHIDDHGYTETYVPYMVNADSLRGTGQLPKFEEDLFKIPFNDSCYYLIPTAEVPVTNIARDEILDANELPVKMACHTPCFRSEAGSYGRDTRGMIRQHQFEKVELVQMVKPEDSDQALEELTGHAEKILQALELPYRLVTLCGGDLGFSAAKTYDIEVWLPGQQKFREISSCSNFRDYQARRMQARWRNPETNKPELLHTINGSGLAVGRTLVAVLENYQQEDGRVAIPKALQPYIGNKEYIG